MWSCGHVVVWPSCGREFKDLIDGIVQGQINPLTATFLKLSVVKWPGRSGYISIDTRREE